MKKFLDKNFLLESNTAQTLYHEYAAKMPIIDYHCHLSPQQIAEDARFENITQVWLYGDHYKWRAMRTNGVDERYCTGDASDRDKFLKWAETVPYTLRNPLYHWTHLELQRYFGIDKILDASTAEEIYDEASDLLKKPEYSVRNLLRKMNVKIVCTTDDPTDSLIYHQQLKKEGFEIRVLPAFRPDNAMNLSVLSKFQQYVEKLSRVSGVTVQNFDDYLQALKVRHDYFAENGCCVSDHGLEEIYNESYRLEDIRTIFSNALQGKVISDEQHNQFRSAMLTYFAEWDHEKGWVQQYHLGALRNNNSRMMQKLGPDTGWDSIGDFSQGRALAGFLDKLDSQDKLAKTILYNLNPADNELIATMIGNFNDGSSAGKIQFGSGWWFLDQKDGMIKQMNALSNMGLISKFVGMLTDSRSFLSYPRHEYFRRILCNLFGEEVENGELPENLPWIGKVIEDICYHNAASYFNWPTEG
ncbi:MULTISPECIES: glucuronate isomerase [Olivibacter]|uniref:Uronate isomerase n=3 Tax=Sphingobacteriaceae TaxID=84566 RepID=F4C1U1_SPHS2|nr:MULTISPECIES: glucuronate isomerase [Olivibacter]MCL4637446.1 glucuronate isomerase [Olivibacter sp. UJ_SKK_5.1]MDM8174684.1 glucuronate isomerase [Olivibacter sp. 47]MDX3913561.1 glucuronate isomerase [Pseudosphingobacterium sp.]QEL01479.1 glucuronate isomerase [Olivibacter sp. LS-1]